VPASEGLLYALTSTDREAHAAQSFSRPSTGERGVPVTVNSRRSSRTISANSAGSRTVSPSMQGRLPARDRRHDRQQGPGEHASRHPARAPTRSTRAALREDRRREPEARRHPDAGGSRQLPGEGARAHHRFLPRLHRRHRPSTAGGTHVLPVADILENADLAALGEQSTPPRTSGGGVQARVRPTARSTRPTRISSRSPTRACLEGVRERRSRT